MMLLSGRLLLTKFFDRAIVGDLGVPTPRPPVEGRDAPPQTPPRKG